MQRLAIDGGTPVSTSPVGHNGERFGTEEENAVLEVLRSGKLNRNCGTRVKEFEARFADHLGVKHAIMSTSGTAAIHIALGALNLDPGSEIITSPITDMGTIMPILLSLCVPVFADLDPETWEISPEDIERKITPRTKAIIPIHLVGNAAPMDAVMDIAERHGLDVIEDCAQAYGTTFNGKHVGTIAPQACFSLNQSKHITCGDGGVTVTDDDALAERALLFADKAWPRQVGRTSLFVAPNYRVTELQAAVALAQLGRVNEITSRRNALGDRLSAAIGDLPGIDVQRSYPNSRHTYWFYAFRVDASLRADVASALAAEGVPTIAGYIPHPVYFFEVFHNGTTFGNSNFPYGCPPFRPAPDPVSYEPGICPVAEDLCRQMIRIPINEFWTDDDIDATAEAIRKVHHWRIAAT
jgi:dTDP-4-amino-4,6-dideoxygalactose transaminase